jgi:hypothetical protein
VEERLEDNPGALVLCAPALSPFSHVSRCSPGSFRLAAAQRGASSAAVEASAGAATSEFEPLDQVSGSGSKISVAYSPNCCLRMRDATCTYMRKGGELRLWTVPRRLM